MCSSAGGRCLRFGAGRELAGRASGHDRAADRRPDPASGHLPDVDAGGGGLRPAILPQPVLLVPSRAALGHRHLRPGRRGAPRPPHGGGAHAARVLPGAKVGIQPQPRAVQCEGARADYDLRELRGGESLFDPYC